MPPACLFVAHWLAVMAFGFLTTGGTAQAATWYVAAGGTGTGTSANPFGRVQDGLNAAQPGDTVTVRPGTYSESIATVRNGTASAPITLRSEGGRGTVTLTAVGTTARLSHAFHLLDGLVFDGQYGANDLILVRSGANNLTVRNTEIRRAGRDCVDMSNQQNVLFEHDVIHHCIWWNGTTQVDAHGIVGGPVRNLTIRDTEIHHVSGDCVQVDAGRSAPGWDQVLLEGSHLWTGPLPAAENGMPAGATPGENAVDTKSGGTNPRATITLRNIVAHGIRSGFITNMAAFNLKENVTVILDGITVYDSEIGFRIRGPGSNGGADVTLMNGVIHTTTYGIRYEDNIVMPKVWNTTFGSNVPNPFFAASSAGTVFDTRNTLVLGGTLPSQAGGGSNRAVSAAAFVNAAANDYHLAPGSPAIDAGTPLAAVTTDRDGAARPSGAAYDVGAFEYGVSAPPPPAGSACDLNGDGATNVVDVQGMVNQAIGVAACTADLNRDGACNVIDVQRVVNAALGGQCVSS